PKTYQRRRRRRRTPASALSSSTAAGSDTTEGRQDPKVVREILGPLGLRRPAGPLGDHLPPELVGQPDGTGDPGPALPRAPVPGVGARDGVPVATEIGFGAAHRHSLHTNRAAGFTAAPPPVDTGGVTEVDGGGRFRVEREAPVASGGRGRVVRGLDTET